MTGGVIIDELASVEELILILIGGSAFSLFGETNSLEEDILIVVVAVVLLVAWRTVATDFLASLNLFLN